MTNAEEFDLYIHDADSYQDLFAEVWNGATELIHFQDGSWWWENSGPITETEARQLIEDDQMLCESIAL
jgi:hypothetical protein